MGVSEDVEGETTGESASRAGEKSSSDKRDDVLWFKLDGVLASGGGGECPIWPRRRDEEDALGEGDLGVNTAGGEEEEAIEVLLATGDRVGIKATFFLIVLLGPG